MVTELAFVSHGITKRTINVPDEYPIYMAAMLLGVSPETLRKWEKDGKTAPARRTSRGDRVYSDADIDALSAWQKEEQAA